MDKKYNIRVCGQSEHVLDKERIYTCTHLNKID